MKVEITQNMIDQGVRNSCDACPVALAVRKAIPACRVVVAHEIRWLTDDGEPHVIPVPNRVRRFIDNFDCGRPVQPFTFDLTVTP